MGQKNSTTGKRQVQLDMSSRKRGAVNAEFVLEKLLEEYPKLKKLYDRLDKDDQIYYYNELEDFQNGLGDAFKDD